MKDSPIIKEYQITPDQIKPGYYFRQESHCDRTGLPCGIYKEVTGVSHFKGYVWKVTIQSLSKSGNPITETLKLSELCVFTVLKPYKPNSY